MSRIRDWVIYTEENGVLGLMRRVVERLIRPIRESSVIDVYCLEAPCRSARPRILVDVVQLKTYSPFLELHANRGRLAHRWQSGQICYAGVVDGKCIHSSWLSFGGGYIGEVHRQISLPSKDGYVFDSFTDPAYRGLGVFPFILSAVSARLERCPGERTWIAVERSNLASTKAIMKVGFEMQGTIRYVRWLWSEKVQVDGNLAVDLVDDTVRPASSPHQRG